MISRLFRIGALAIAALLAGCAVPQKNVDYTAFRESKPASILVLPPVNSSVDVAASAAVLAQADVVRVRAFDDIIESGVLKVAMYENFPPYSYQQDGQPRGVDFELAQKLAEGLGLKLEVLWVTPDETLDDDLRNFIWKGHYLRRDVLADVMLRVPYDREFSLRRNDVGELPRASLTCEDIGMGEPRGSGP